MAAAVHLTMVDESSKVSLKPFNSWLADIEPSENKPKRLKAT
jgi:hypothetical protein